MPKGVYTRKVGIQRRDSKPERDLEIAARLMLGESVRSLSREYGLSAVRVHSIGKRMKRDNFVAIVRESLKRKRA